MIPSLVEKVIAARKMGVHVRTIEKVLSGGSWVHV